MEQPNSEPLTARLRGVPQDEWTQADADEEVAALNARIENNTNAHDTITWLLKVAKPLSDRFPDTPLADLVHLLPEPERSIAHDITHPPAVKLSDLPLERSNRQPWQADVERAVEVTMEHHARFTLADVLDAAGIDHTNSKLWTAASAYAKKILDVAMNPL